MVTKTYTAETERKIDSLGFRGIDPLRDTERNKAEAENDKNLDLVFKSTTNENIWLMKTQQVNYFAIMKGDASEKIGDFRHLTNVNGALQPAYMPEFGGELQLAELHVPMTPAAYQAKVREEIQLSGLRPPDEYAGIVRSAGSLAGEASKLLAWSATGTTGTSTYALNILTEILSRYLWIHSAICLAASVDFTAVIESAESVRNTGIMSIEGMPIGNYLLDAVEVCIKTGKVSAYIETCISEQDSVHKSELQTLLVDCMAKFIAIVKKAGLELVDIMEAADR